MFAGKAVCQMQHTCVAFISWSATLPKRGICCMQALCDLLEADSLPQTQPHGGGDPLEVVDHQDGVLSQQLTVADAAPLADLVAVPTGPRAASADPSEASDAGPHDLRPAPAAAAGVEQTEPLSLATIHTALQQMSASAVPDVSDLLCCPITHVRL